MPDPVARIRVSTDGKFFRSGSRRVWLKAVTYGPFPGDGLSNCESDFRKITDAGFDTVRLFEMPDRRLLDTAAQCGLRIFGGLEWRQNADFFTNPGFLAEARVRLTEALRSLAGHPALAGVFVGNEIPADLVRWMGPLRVRMAIESLIALGRSLAPGLCFAYANYPSTEYLEPENADFTAFNVYLEEPNAYRKYLRRLHHIAGDRPLMISEFGLDSRRNGLARQAEVLRWAVEISRDEETAGMAVYAWSDRWWNAGAEVTDWDFGLTDRNRSDKPALAAVTEAFSQATHPKPVASGISFSVIICTRNGCGRIGKCLKAATRLEGGPDLLTEIIVVDDGSDDGTADWVAKNFPDIRLIRLPASGLSAARNAGAQAALGTVLAYTDDDCEPDREWLLRLVRVLADGRFAAAGGPNLPPEAQTWQQAVVSASPGAPSHVMLDDEEAEHLPGCNLVVTRAAFDAVAGFDPQFHTAGDDVDFCWRLRDAGYRLGFAPGAFVWHHRRPGIRAFLRQQLGYGRAERLLLEKHPHKFTGCGSIRWDGFIYGGGPVRVMEDSIIHHGPMGAAGYQSVTNRMLPLRGLSARFDRPFTRWVLHQVTFLVPALRAWARCRRLPQLPGHRSIHADGPPAAEYTLPGVSREQLLAHFLTCGWEPGGPSAAWDLQKPGTRVLMATERGDCGTIRTLLRAWGDTQPTTETLASAHEADARAVRQNEPRVFSRA